MASDIAKALLDYRLAAARTVAPKLRCSRSDEPARNDKREDSLAELAKEGKLTLLAGLIR